MYYYGRDKKRRAKKRITIAAISIAVLTVAIISYLLFSNINNHDNFSSSNIEVKQITDTSTVSTSNTFVTVASEDSLRKMIAGSIDTISVITNTQKGELLTSVKSQESILHAEYKVISKAHFYDKPDEQTKRKAFITHWNNSYAEIRPLDEKNGFIYVVFKNHNGQFSKGWLRKKDLKQAAPLRR